MSSIPSIGGPQFDRPAAGAKHDGQRGASASAETSKGAPPGRVDARLEGLRARRPARETVEIEGTTWDVGFRCGQWTSVTKSDGPDSTAVTDYRMVNLDDSGIRQFYEIRPGQYNEPKIRREPDRALALPTQVRYVNADGSACQPDEKIAGIVLRDEAGNVVGRYSLTNATRQKIEYELSDDGTLRIDGKVFHLNGLFSPDKNRIENYDAFFSPTKPDVVTMLELEDVTF